MSHKYSVLTCFINNYKMMDFYKFMAEEMLKLEKAFRLVKDRIE